MGCSNSTSPNKITPSDSMPKVPLNPPMCQTVPSSPKTKTYSDSSCQTDESLIISYIEDFLAKKSPEKLTKSCQTETADTEVQIKSESRLNPSRGFTTSIQARNSIFLKDNSLKIRKSLNEGDNLPQFSQKNEKDYSISEIGSFNEESINPLFLHKKIKKMNIEKQKPSSICDLELRRSKFKADPKKRRNSRFTLILKESSVKVGSNANLEHLEKFRKTDKDLLNKLGISSKKQGKKIKILASPDALNGIKNTIAPDNQFKITKQIEPKKPICLGKEDNNEPNVKKFKIKRMRSHSAAYPKKKTHHVIISGAHKPGHQVWEIGKEDLLSKMHKKESNPSILSKILNLFRFWKNFGRSSK